MFTTVAGGQALKVNYRENKKKDPHWLDLDARCISIYRTVDDHSNRN